MPAPPCCLESGRASLWAYSIAHLPPLGSETSILSRPRIFHLAPPYSGTTLPETLSNSKLIGSSSTGVKEKWQHTCCVLSDFNSISAMGMCDKPGQPAAAGVCVCVCARAQLRLTLCNSKDNSPPGSSVHGISQARILEFAISYSKGSSRPWVGTHVFCVSCIGRQWIL